MVLGSGSDIVLLSGDSHATHAIFGEAGRMTTPESLHESAEFFGVLQYKNRFTQIFDENGICIIPFNKLVAYHNSFK
jgi:hypothetical protein